MLHNALMSFLLLAQAEESEPRNYAISWAIIVLSMILGLTAALRPAKREERVVKPKSE